VTALSQSELIDRGVRQAGDIADVVPNLLLNQPYGPEAQPTFTLRGVTTQDFSENQSSPIAMYVDEVYKPVGALQALQIYDLDRVEVLRGPQGTLYGKNATGGAVNFYSRNPSLTDYDGYAILTGGNYSLFEAQAAVGGPLIDDRLGWRAAMLYEKRDGWVHSIAVFRCLQHRARRAGCLRCRQCPLVLRDHRQARLVDRRVDQEHHQPPVPRLCPQPGGRRYRRTGFRLRAGRRAAHLRRGSHGAILS
jgi:outer membrane receptor protein involved in Fe transport